MASEILVTGVTGFVGATLAPMLVHEDYFVRGLSRSVRPPRGAVGRTFVYDAETYALPTEAVDGAKGVVHLAGEPVSGRWTRSKKRAIERSRTLGTRAIVDAIAKAKEPPSVLVCASAIGYYGSRGDEELHEASGPGDDFLAHVCREWEEEAMRAEELGVRVVRMRLSLVLGADGGALGAMLPLFKMGLGGKIGDGGQYWPWIHVEDAARMIVCAIEDPSWTGAYNCATPTPVRQSEFATTLARVLSRPAFLPAPRLALETVLGGFATELLASRRVVPKRAVEAGFAFTYPDLYDALRAATGRD
ncbi:MAG: TIGR01777 family oxidoreductase [Sandaracinaceae bacterium]